MRILAINPGSTSTKIAVFDDINQIMVKNIKHSSEVVAEFPSIIDQYEFRKEFIINTLIEEQINLDTIDIVVGRGGLLKPIPGGVYRVNETMIEDLKMGIRGEHASNIGAILAREIANETGKDIDAYIVDPVVVDEMDNIARYSGLPELPRMSIFHALNQKAVARRYAREMNTKYENLRLIVVHLGGGITVGAHKYGKVVDVNNGLDGDGPFAPERTGSLPVGGLTKMCFSGKYMLVDIRKKITGKGGMVAYLGTNNAAEVEERIKTGDEEAKRVYEAMAYQIAKEIGSFSVVLFGDIDCILITGGLAYSEKFTNLIIDRVKFLAPVKVYPGEDEMTALAEGVYYALHGEQEIKEYV